MSLSLGLGRGGSVCRRVLRRLLLVSVLAPFAAHAAPPVPAAANAVDPDAAGRTVFVRGPVAAEAKGAKRDLKARDSIYQQDILLSGEQASARFVMRDKTMLALQPNTRISISEYHFKEGDPAGDKMVTGVVTGSLRALTGLVDKRNKDAVVLKTQVATIGVRGTAIRVVMYADGHEEITFDFGFGWVENGGGRVDVGEGFTVVVVDGQTLPTLVKRPLDPNDPAALARKLAKMAAGDAKLEARALAKSLSDADQILLLGMLDQAGADQEVLLDVLQGLLEGNPDLAPEILLTETRLHQELAPLILESAVKAGVPVERALTEVLKGLESPTQREIDLVLIQAVHDGISMDGAQGVLQQLRDAGLCT